MKITPDALKEKLFFFLYRFKEVRKTLSKSSPLKYHTKYFKEAPILNSQNGG